SDSSQAGVSVRRGRCDWQPIPSGTTKQRRSSYENEAHFVGDSFARAEWVRSESDYDQRGSWRQAILCPRSRILGWSSLLRLGARALGSATPSSRLDPRLLCSSLIDELRRIC